MTALKVSLVNGAQNKAKLVATIAADYYRMHGRFFPWRTERSAYKVALAEILLQKTRAASAAPVYGSLLEQYPDPSALSAAGELALERDLAPLGLSKKRAAQLRALGAKLNEVGESALHNWEYALSKIPGLGAYGARAVACFSIGQRVGIVDANIARIFRRVFSVPSNDPRAIAYQQIADKIALATTDVRATNFGLLDLGASICVRRPRCSICPFSSFCDQFEVTEAIKGRSSPQESPLEI